MERREFETLALEHLDAAHRLAMHLTRNPDAAADLVQEAYLRALRASATFEEQGGGIKPWLLTIVHNVFRSRLVRDRRAPAAAAVDEFDRPDGRERRPDEAPAAWDMRSFDWEHVDARLKEAIEALSPEHRFTLLLWGVEGLKYREIAAVLEVPIGTVMSRLHRARRILAEELGSLQGEFGVRGAPDDELV